MDRNFNDELALAMTRFAAVLMRVTVPPIDVTELVNRRTPVPEIANKLNVLIGEQRGTVAHVQILMLENWVDMWHAASVVAAVAERDRRPDVRQASLNSYACLAGQLLAMLELMEGSGGDDIAVFVAE